MARNTGDRIAEISKIWPLRQIYIIGLRLIGNVFQNRSIAKINMEIGLVRSNI